MVITPFITIVGAHLVMIRLRNGRNVLGPWPGEFPAAEVQNLIGRELTDLPSEAIVPTRRTGTSKEGEVAKIQGTRTGVLLTYVYYHGIYCVQPWDSWG